MLASGLHHRQSPLPHLFRNSIVNGKTPLIQATTRGIRQRTDIYHQDLILTAVTPARKARRMRSMPLRPTRIAQAIYRLSAPALDGEASHVQLSCTIKLKSVSTCRFGGFFLYVIIRRRILCLKCIFLINIKCYLFNHDYHTHTHIYICNYDISCVLIVIIELYIFLPLATKIATERPSFEAAYTFNEYTGP